MGALPRERALVEAVLGLALAELRRVEHAATVAARAGVTEFRANAKPEDKLALVRELQAQGLQVAMVGDGVNDAPALAQADIGIAMSTGTDVAIEAGDITLLNGDVSKIAEAIALSRATLSAIKQNLTWAFGYNVIAIPIAAAGLLNPIIAGATMAMSSVSVMANSLRLRTKAKAIAEASGNPYGGTRRSFLSANRGPIFSMSAAAAILVVPLVLFTGIDRGWFSSDGLGPRDVGVGLKNWSVDLSTDHISAGKVTFKVGHNEDHAHGSGPGQIHNLVVLRKDADGSFDQVAKTRDLGMGESQDLTLNLDKGEYQLECAVVEESGGRTISHAAEGMRTVFRVE